LSFDIYGGTGANNQQYTDEIEPVGSGVACLNYATGREAGVHYDSGTFKTVCFSFGFEGIAQDADRDLVMDRILDFFDADLIGVPAGSLVKPFLAGNPLASPNPFNPSTTIQFEVAGSRSAEVEVDLYDIRGSLIRTLWRGPLSPGAQDLVWDGRANNGNQVASGVYLALVKLADQQQTVKLTLTK